MNPWLAAAIALLPALALTGWVCLRGRALDRLVGLEMTAIVEALLLVCLSEGTHRVPFYDLAVALALLSFGGGLVFARFLERWL